MASGDNIARTVDIVKKAEYDKRQYRGLVLENGLTALLISDPNVISSAASLLVPVGSLSVPKDLTGIANLCSYLLYTGTQKYPIERSFEAFLFQNAGSSYTLIGHDYIIFNFDVKANAFRKALDRFAQFFIAPLITPNGIHDQILKTLYQHFRNVRSDSRRIDQMIRNGVDPNHPLYQNYTTGTRNTLINIPLSKNVSIYEEFSKFIFKWFSSHLMCLTILGKEDLNVLEELTLSFFGPIKKKNVEIPRWDPTIYNTEQLATKTMVVPLRNIIEQHIIFQIPDQAEFYKSKPCWYLSYFFEHEGPNSILGILKNKKWCTSLNAQRHREAKGIEFFRIKIYLTKEGLNHTDDIMKLIFQFVNMIKCKRQLPKWFYEEYRTLQKMRLSSEQKISSINYTHQLCVQMTLTKLEDVLVATQYEVQDWRPDLIVNLLSYFTPNNMRITIVSKEFKDIANTVDRFYRTSYITTKIPRGTLEMWQKDDVSHILTIPPKNQWIVFEERLVDVDGDEPDQPCIFYESRRLKCWLKKDTNFRLPKSFVSIILFCNSVATEVNGFTVKFLFMRLFKNYFAFVEKEARRINLHINMASIYNGYHVTIDGFDGTLHIFLQQFIDKLTTYKIDPVHFADDKENIIREMINYKEMPSYKIGLEHQNVFFKKTFTDKQIKDAAKNITIEHMEEFINTFQTHVRMEMMIYGNVDCIKAQKLIEILEHPFRYNETIFNELPFFYLNETNLGFEDNSHIIHMDVNGLYLSDSSICLTFYCGDHTVNKYVILKLFNIITRLHIWNRMSVHLLAQFQHQFGVRNHYFTAGNSIFLTYVVQSSHNPPLILEKIEECIESIWRWFPYMQTDIFETWKSKLEAMLLKKPGSMLDQMNVYRYEFTQPTFDFNRAKTEVNELRSVTKADVLRFYRQYIKQTGHKRRLNRIHVWPTIQEHNMI